jgi:hypothetical protein
MTRDEVIDVLTVVAAATRRTVGAADVDIWQEVMGHCDKQLSLKAVRAHLRERPGVWLEPGHVVAGVRAIRNEEIERESDEQRDVRQRALEAKVKEDVAELAAGKGIPAAVRFHRPQSNYLTVRCPWCKASVGRPCTVPQTNERPAGGTREPEEAL